MAGPFSRVQGGDAVNERGGYDPGPRTVEELAPPPKGPGAGVAPEAPPDSSTDPPDPQDVLDAALIAHELTQARKVLATHKLRLAMSRAGVTLAQPAHDRQILKDIAAARKTLDLLERLAVEGLPEPGALEVATADLAVPTLRG